MIRTARADRCTAGGGRVEVSGDACLAPRARMDGRSWLDGHHAAPPRLKGRAQRIAIDLDPRTHEWAQELASQRAR